MKLKLAVLISGSGSTAATVQQKILDAEIDAEIVCLIASRDCPGIEKLKKLGVKNTYIVSKKNYADEDSFAKALLEIYQKHEIELAAHYGWLTKIPALLIKETKAKLINQHPGPLDPGRPDFGGRYMYGARVHAARLLFSQLSLAAPDYSEVCAHWVTENYDEGQLIGLKKVPITEEDLDFDPEDFESAREKIAAFQQKAIKYEHQLQVEVLKNFISAELQEISRTEPLIDELDYELLDRCKQWAKSLYE